ncbi:MAG: DUF4407 domain-containing protein, partial [Ginsengibacter sp.]
MNNKQGNRLKITDLIGVDYSILLKSDKSTARKFRIASQTIVLITLLTFCSLYYAFTLLFGNFYIEVLISLFFAFLFLNIYILLLNTFSKENLPSRHPWFFINISNISRIGFVVFMAFIISKPVEIFLFREKLNSRIDSFRAGLVQKFLIQNDKLYQKDISVLEKEEASLINEINFGDIHGGQELKATKKRLYALKADKQEAEKQVHSIIYHSNFFIKRVEIANRSFPLSWLICAAVIFIFLLPGYLIYSIPGESKYYQQKHEKDKKLILEYYKKFKVE